MRLAVPDLVSSSYFPALAAARLAPADGDRVPLSLEHLFPVRAAAEALRDGQVEFLTGPAHAALFAFPRWRGGKILMALSQRTYWMLVVRADLEAESGAVDSLHDMNVAAAPGPAHALRRLLVDSGVDLDRSRITIAPLPASHGSGGSFGIRAARALSDGVIDAFWANSMAAQIAVREGVGRVLLDPRRGDGPPEAATYTFPALVTTDAMIADRPHDVRAVVRAVVLAQSALKAAPQRAEAVVSGLFPPLETSLIQELVRRDLPHYSPQVSEETVDGLNRFTQAIGLVEEPVAYGDIVASDVRDLWEI